MKNKKLLEHGPANEPETQLHAFGIHCTSSYSEILLGAYDKNVSSKIKLRFLSFTDFL
jgi:hypothetical protein